jgi:hypothetical protein
MPSDTIRLYQSPSSPNSRRVRIVLAEKGLSIPLVAVDLSKGEQHSEAYCAINPRRVVPSLANWIESYRQVDLDASLAELRSMHQSAEAGANRRFLTTPAYHDPRLYSTATIR